ncbi:MAG: hypothetical protein A3D65_04130 [Candidatus Lloydbacteria bacterium RIFCSPHIGHO2_02_FULL_50_13]|uniref:Septum formation initiator n=1 Tax=Candidatus Lloydbacteria bacterium RIFCSPHIGHO2_02_FULL_50_13 TaxID=1798661 RepID=A0A1G2DC36_9BACT|nr:MAG: hypothetical protein A3D65_04130 [Candidatus Lloydbacteria bacterium RIFCSPHIGHO2_02_FULL_50_13]
MGKLLDFRERSKLRRLLYAKPTIIALAVLVALLLNSSWGAYQKSRGALSKEEKAERELAALVAREKELNEDIARLKTEAGVEAEIRERFMVAKEGEKVMIITDPDAAKVHTVTVADNSPSVWEKMMGAVGIGGE